MARHRPSKPQPKRQMIRLTASPAKLVGIVEASDEKAALKLAVNRLRVRPADVPRLIVLPA